MEAVQAVVGVAATLIVPITTDRDPCHAPGRGLPYLRLAAAADTDLDPDLPRIPQDLVLGHLPVAVEAAGAATTGVGATMTTTGGGVPAAIAMRATTGAAGVAAAIGIGDKSVMTLMARVRRFGTAGTGKGDQTGIPATCVLVSGVVG